MLNDTYNYYYYASTKITRTYSCTSRYRV